MNRYRTTAKDTDPCARCGWTHGAHLYAASARAKMAGHPTFEKPGAWPCPEFVRVGDERIPGWGPISATGWFVLAYIVFLLGIVTVARWLA